MSDMIDRQAAIDAVSRERKELLEILAECEKKLIELPAAEPQKQHGIIFQEIVVRYPSYNTYPEYKGKPYFSIKYTENGQEFVGYGTYKPEVLSEYLKKYFMPSAESNTIYCKDCKFCSYEPDGKNADVYVCNYSHWRRSEGGLFPDDFCSRAEEREDG